MTAKALDRTAAIREILVQVWDPIGVDDAIRTFDSYDVYLEAVERLLANAPSDQALVNYLFWVETERMGLSLPRPHERLLSVVKALRAIG